MAKNLTQQEIQQDPLLDNYARIAEFYESNRNVIIGSAIVVMLAIALAIGYHFYQQSQNNKAEQLMGVPENFFLQGDYQKALNGSGQGISTDFKQIINDYSGTKAGNLAHYYAAVSAFKLDQPEKALNYIDDFDMPDGILGVAPMSFKGMLLRQLGKQQQAAKAFVNAAEMDKNDSTTPYNYLQAAEAYEQAKNTQNARKYAQMVLDKYPDSPQITDAQKLLGRLDVAS